MRKLMWFVIGFGFACGLCAYSVSASVSEMLFAAVCLIMLFFRQWKPLLVLGLGCAIGFGWFGIYRQQYLQTAIASDGTEYTGTVTVSDYSYATDYGVAADGRLELEGKTYAVRVYVNEEVSLTPGDLVTSTFRLRYTPGGMDQATYHAGKGIFLLAYQTGTVEIMEGDPSGFLPAVFGETIKERLRLLLPEDLFAFAQALLLGDGSELTYETDTAFKVSGIRHIIAVSGLHVMILYSLLNTITFRNKWLTAILCLPVLGFFAAMAGFTPSVIRACIMVALMILAQLCNREYDPSTALAFSVLVMLTANPLAVTSVSFQLSVGCVAGIQLFSNRIREWIQLKLNAEEGRGVGTKLKRRFASSVSVSLGAMSLTTPLSAYYFGSVSLIGVLTNLLTLWVVNFLFNGLVVVCGISFLSMKFAHWVTWLVVWPGRFILAAAKLLGSFPRAALYTRSPYIVAWLVFIYILLVIFLLQERKKPVILTGCAAIGLLAAVFASWLEPLTDDIRVTMLDVGQGQSILLQSEGKTFLVDCGGENAETTADVIVETLLSEGVTFIDGIILTHCDEDHAGALENLLTRMDCGGIFYPATESITMDNVNCNPVSEDLQIQYGSSVITILGPIFVEDPNENSLCVLFTRGDCDILITGDRGVIGETALLTDYVLPDVELLIAGHHGSKYSTTEALLNAVRPESIFVSAGADNRFGHPSQEMLDRAEKFGAEVYRTDLQGTLIFRR